MANRVRLSDFAQKDENISIEARQKGNVLYREGVHNRDVHKEILFQYSKSIAYAPVDSHELALAYSNRSLLLLHLQLYNECLIDIENSKQISKSHDLNFKLEGRKRKCLGLMKNLSKQNYRKPVSTTQNTTAMKNLQSYEVGFNKVAPSPQIPVASQAVAAVYNDRFGRHLVATRDIEAGEVILIEEGYMRLPKNSQVYLVCIHCLKFAWNGIPCNKCAFGIYCSEECKKEAEQDYHEVECALLPFMNFVMFEESGLMNSLILALRILIKAVRKEGIDAVLNEVKPDKKNLEGMTINGILHHDKFRALYNLLGHQENVRNLYQRNNLNESKVIQLMAMHTTIFDTVKNSDDGVIKSDIILQLEKILGKLIDIIKVNVLSYHGFICLCSKSNKTKCDCDSSRGMVFATCASLINHSCAPNVCRMNIPNGKVVFFTYTPVKLGEQLCDSYGPTVGVALKSRKETLEQQFFFTCNCKSCKEKWFEDGIKLIDTRKYEDETIQEELMDEFDTIYPGGLDSSVFKDEKKWSFDEEQLKMALKWTDLIYKYYNDPKTRFVLSAHYKMYSDIAFNELFGENAKIPENCLLV